MRICVYFSVGGHSPCTGLAAFEEDIVSVGEDGCMCLLTARQKTPIRRIGKVTVLNLEFIIIIILIYCMVALFCPQKVLTVAPYAVCAF
jgi:hypothetical protein